MWSYAKSERGDFDMKYHLLHDFRTSTPFKEKFSDHIKDVHELKLLTNFDANLVSFLGGVMNNVLSIKFVTPSGHEVKLTPRASVYKDL